MFLPKVGKIVKFCILFSLVIVIVFGVLCYSDIFFPYSSRKCFAKHLNNVKKKIKSKRKTVCVFSSNKQA